MAVADVAKHHFRFAIVITAPVAAAVGQAERVGLAHLGADLDAVARWDRDLGLGDQERLRYARLLLARPDWLICDEGLDPADDDGRQLLLSILADELAGSAVVNISQRKDPAGFYGRVVELVASASEAPPARVRE